MHKKLKIPEFKMTTMFDGIRIFGPHEYHDGMGDCSCGAYMGSANSRAPLGIDPFGACPNNLIKIVEKETDGMGAPNNSLKEDLSGNIKFITIARIHMAESEVLTLTKKLEDVEPDKLTLAEENKKLLRENGALRSKISRVAKVLTPE